jgi:benzoate/toluate 1,2-dioxygenase subunit beta
MESTKLNVISGLLYREGTCLDEQRWDDWLALFAEDCEYWLAAWKSDHLLAECPKTEISLIYHNSRSRLEERILRIRSGMSPASTPLPRTWHSVSNIRLGEMRDGLLTVYAQWQTHSYRFGQTDTLYGRYEYRLLPIDHKWLIKAKKIVLINDTVHTALDVYHI